MCYFGVILLTHKTHSRHTAATSIVSFVSAKISTVNARPINRRPLTNFSAVYFLESNMELIFTRHLSVCRCLTGSTRASKYQLYIAKSCYSHSHEHRCIRPINLVSREPVTRHLQCVFQTSIKVPHRVQIKTGIKLSLKILPHLKRIADAFY